MPLLLLLKCRHPICCAARVCRKSERQWVNPPTAALSERRPTPVAGSPLAPLLVPALPPALVLPRLLRTTLPQWLQPYSARPRHTARLRLSGSIRCMRMPSRRMFGRQRVRPVHGAALQEVRAVDTARIDRPALPAMRCKGECRSSTDRRSCSSFNHGNARVQT